MSDEQASPPRSRGRSRYVLALLPLLVFGGFAAIAAKMLYEQDVNGLDVSAIPSALIGTKAPSLTLPPLEGSNVPALNDTAIAGKLTLVNVFASWCTACRYEHPLFMQLEAGGVVPIHGLNYKDRPEDAAKWLDDLGDPYTRTGADLDGRVAIDWGVYGVPETFVISADGVIVHKHIGPVSAKDLEQTIHPLIARLRQ